MSDYDEMLEAALEYALMGWKVFPVNGKVPFYNTHGFYDASADRETVCRLWAAYPNANIAIATGAGSGLTVIDIDDEAAAAPVLEFFPTPPTVTATTGRGRHLYYTHSTGVKSENKPFGEDTGIDVKSNGGYVIAPPSLHASGKRYAWADGQAPYDTDPERLPEAWAEALAGASKAKADPGQQRTADAPIPEGNRHGTLVSMAGTMRRAGFDASAILAALRNTNETRCAPPLPDSEVMRIAKDIGAKPTENTAGAEAEGAATFEAWQEQVKSPRTIVSMESVRVADIPPRDWGVSEMFPMGELSIIGARKRQGKTWFSLQIAQAVASGAAFLGRETQQGRVLYWPSELDETGIHERAQRWPVLHCGLDVVLGKADDRPIPRGSAFIVELEEIITTGDYRVVFVDMLGAFTPKGGDSNAYEISDFFLALRRVAFRTGAAIIGTWHTGKAEYDDPALSLIGSTGIGGQAGSIVTIAKKKGQNEVKITVSGNHAREQELTARTVDGMFVSLEEVDLSGIMAQPSAADRVTLDALKRYPEGIGAPALAEALGRTDKAGKGNVRTSLNRLKDSGLAHKANDLWFATERTKANESEPSAQPYAGKDSTVSERTVQAP